MVRDLGALLRKTNPIVIDLRTKSNRKRFMFIEPTRYHPDVGRDLVSRRPSVAGGTQGAPYISGSSVQNVSAVNVDGWTGVRLSW